jgi:hypothetical protein
MSNDALKAWLDSMPIDEVRHKVERLEAKLADLRMLERLYEERHGAAAPEQPQPGWPQGG